LLYRLIAWGSVAAVCALGSGCIGQEPAQQTAQQPAQQPAPPPGQTAAQKPDAQAIMQKTLATYSAAKTYQADWTYTLEQGEGNAKQVQKMTIEIKSKAPTRLLFHVAPAPDQKAPPGREPLPELRVVVDGKTAWFENTSDKTFYKVPLPKNAAISPLMFMPLIPSSTQVQRQEDVNAGGKTYFVLGAVTPQGGTGRMEIDSGTYHIRGMSTMALVGLTKLSSAIVMEKETFDGDVPDSVFSYKPVRGAKESPAPQEAAALFGPPDGK
jgi:outer membrane lipoprotein-sorting protein